MSSDIEIVGEETVQEAAKAFTVLCTRLQNSYLFSRVRLFVEISGWENMKRPIGKCPSCATGCIHSPGVWQHDGRISFGGPLICDACGWYVGYKVIGLY